MFRPPEREQMKREPIVRFSRRETVTDPDSGEQKEIEKNYVAIAGIELEVYDGPEGSIFEDEEFEDFALDEASLDLLKRYAVAINLNQPVLVEGETDIGKSKALEYQPPALPSFALLSDRRDRIHRQIPAQFV